jgi:thiosulfate/3-mercaptopyruvate sulfurtransferase
MAFLAITMLFVFIISSVYAAEYPNPSVLATTEYVAARIGDPNVVLLDTRKADEYKKEHIPGAINLGYGREILRDKTARAYTVVKESEKILGDAGISMDKEIIIYGELKKNPYNYAVPFWILEYLGHQKVRFYPGGITEWKAAGHEVKSGEEKLSPTTFKANVKEDRIATTEWLLINYNNPNVVVVDVRGSKEYKGDDCRALRCGHIPGAVHIDVKKANYNTTTWELLPADKLLDNYKKVSKDKDVVLYCQSATRTTYTYFVLRLLGYEKIRNYDDSWRIWGSRYDTPIEGEQWYNFASLNKKVKKIAGIEKIGAEALSGVITVNETAEAAKATADLGVEAAKKAEEAAKKAEEAGINAAQKAQETADMALTTAAQKADRGQVFGAYLVGIIGIFVGIWAGTKKKS